MQANVESGMDWLVVTWCMAGSACLTLSLLNFVIWLNDRRDRVHLLFAIAALGVAGVAAGELMIMRSQTPEEFGERMQWLHLPIFIAIVSIVWFVRLYFQAGRIWLAWLVCSIRALLLILNFSVSPNLNFTEITGLREVTLIGGVTTHVAEGVLSQRTRVGELSSVLLLIYVLDASVTLWRRGGRSDRRRAIRVGGSMTLFIALGAGHVALIHAGVVHWPYMISFAFLIPLVAMGYELGADVVRGTRLARELQDSQTQLRDNKQQMEIAVTAASLGLWRWDIARDQLWVSDRGRMLLDLNGDDRIDLHRFVNAVVPEDRDSLRRAIAQSLDTGREHEGEYGIRLPDGTLRWIALRGYRELNGDAKPSVMHGVAFDVTNRRQEEDQFRAVVEASPHALVVVDAHGTIKLVNAQTETAFGHSRRHLIGQSINVLIPDPHRSVLPDQQNSVSPPLDRPMGGGSEMLVQRDDGSTFPAEVRLNPLRTSHSAYTIYTIIDITERKNVERERLRQRSELAHLSRVAMLGELSGSLAHELNQPLTAILSNAQAAQEFLSDDPGDLAEVRVILQDIVNEDRRAGEVIRRLRLLFRKGEMQCELTSLNDLVLDVLKLINSELINHGVSVDTNLAADLPTIQGDRVQLQQVLINLMINASDAMAETAAVDRTLRVTTRLDDERCVLLSIADAGCGIPQDQLDQVFEPFHTTKTTGMGLGLAVCRTIIAAHGGRIWATNNSDRGACFHVRFSGEGSNEL